MGFGLPSGQRSFGGLLTEQLGVIGPLVGTVAGGWGPFGGLLTEQLGVIGPLPAPRQMVRDRLVGC